MEDLQLFDPEIVLHFSEDDQNLASQMLMMALEDIPQFLSEAIDLYNSGDSINSAARFHKIKGIASVCGSEIITQRSSECEVLLKSSPESRDLDSKIMNLKQAVEDFCTVVKLREWNRDL